MVCSPLPPRPLLALLLLGTLLALLPSPARADEVFVLDNGEALRGWVIQEKPDGVLIRLTGFIQEARVEIPRHRIVRRFVPEGVGPPPWTTAALPRPTGRAGTGGETATDPWRHPPARAEVPDPDPPPERESFFHRLARTIVLSVPRDAPGRMAIACLLLVALLVLIVLGGRMADIESMGLPKAAILAALLGGFLVMDVYSYSDVLRADRAVWVLLGQAVAWLGAASLLLRAGTGRVAVLFAFVLFHLTVVVMTVGAILMSI